MALLTELARPRHEVEHQALLFSNRLENVTVVVGDLDIPLVQAEEGRAA